MKLGWLWVFILWYGLISLASVLIPDDIEHTPMSDRSFSDLNVTGFDAAEIDEGSFFGGIIGIATSVGRFLGFILFGIGLPSDTPSGFATFLIFWNTAITLTFIAWFVSLFWDG